VRSQAISAAMAAGGGKIINIDSMMSIFDANFTQAYKLFVTAYSRPAPTVGPTKVWVSLASVARNVFPL
jgi:hypothetical protein